VSGPFSKRQSSKPPVKRVPWQSGRYDVKDEIARGGMGYVYRATDRAVGREVAYKRLRVAPEGSPARATALFQREYNTLAQLSHPAIVEVYEYGNDAFGPYYTMELLSGKDLLELAPMPIHDVCRVLRDIASALALIHARRLIHRDVSPGNVRMTADGRAKLLDFGALTSFGTPPDLVGTPAFMAPEMLSGGPLDQRVDLYSLGALAYWALTRRAVVRVRGLDDLRAAWALPIERPSTITPMPKPLEDLVLWLLHRDPTGRASSAAEVIERLTAIADLPAEPEEQKVAYSYLAHPPLVGRGDVVVQLEAALGQVTDRAGGVVLLEAEPGAGRSAILDHLTREAQLIGATVLRADASADVGSFGLARTLTRLGLALDRTRAGSVGERDTHFDQLSDAHRASREQTWSPLEASQRQARTLARMEKLLIDTSERNPTVLLIDELHRADSESLALVASLAAEAHKHPLLLVVSARIGATDADAYRKIAERARRIPLARLTETETLELVNSVFGRVGNSHRLARWLHEQSSGNAARIMDLARLLMSRDLIHYTAGTFTLPHDVNIEAIGGHGDAALLTRLLDLSAGAREIAALLAISELPLALELIADVLGLAARETVLAVEELKARELARFTDQRAALSSAALSDALQTSLAEGDLRALHLKAARALLRIPNASGELRMQAGVHLLKAGEDVEAAELLTAPSEGDWLGGKTPIPLLETVLEVLRRHGRTDEQCLCALVPLVRGGFFGDMRAQRRHLDRTLTALANVCGVTTAAKLTPRFGPKLALVLGVLWAILRHGFTPKKYRFGSFKDTLAALLSILSATTAAAASAFDTEDAFAIVRRFEPLRAFGADSAPSLTIEFCLATAEVGAGKFGQSIARYGRLLERFERPVQGMNKDVHLQFRQGILHGLAQAKAVDASPESLTLADELERKHVFFAPHAEVIRASFHGQRGEQDESTRHRERGELLALRGGISWSSVTVMTLRATYMAMGTSDLVAIVRILPELERLSEIAPKMALVRDAALAFLELARGRPERAVALYEALFSSPHAPLMPVHLGDRTAYARALCAAGRKAEALAVCSELIAMFSASETLSYRRVVLQEAAEIETAMDNHAAARARLEQLFVLLKATDNPFWLGSIHRAFARLSLREGDRAGFDDHARVCAEYYSATRNPSLIRQAEELLGEAADRTAVALAALNDELDELTTSHENDEERIAKLTGGAVEGRSSMHERLAADNDTSPPSRSAQPETDDELPSERPRKRA
jgi:hypothetical protein